MSAAAVPRLPAAIADVLVIGVGDPQQTMSVGGHASRQDTVSLKQLAVRLGGVFHQGNTRHPPSAMLDELSMIEPRITEGDGLRRLAIACSVGGVTTLALIGPLLSIAGRPRSWSRGWRGMEGLS